MFRFTFSALLCGAFLLGVAMFGWRSADAAKTLGFTHHGSYFGIPLYLGFSGEPGADPEDAPMVAVKWAPLEWVMDIFTSIEGALDALMFPDDPPVFRFKVGARL